MNESNEFDRAMAQLGDGRESLFFAMGRSVSGIAGADSRLTVVPWDELEDLPEKDAEDTEYWHLTLEEQAARSREWRSLVLPASPKPSKPVRYELTKLFGSTRRAKVFVEWVRASTNRSHTEAMRWNRCVACGGDIAFYGLQHGDVGCYHCGAANDTTIYGDEKLSKHITFARITHLNGMQASSFGGRSQEMPDFTITRGEP